MVLCPEEPGGPATQAPRERTIELAIEDGAMSPDEVEVGEGYRVRLQITTPGPPTEVHLHGYDLQRDVAPRGPATL